MSEKQSLTITFTAADPDTGLSGDDWLRIEQPDWPENDSSNFYEWAEAQGETLTLRNYSRLLEEFRSQCEGDGSICAEIWVHKSRPDLQYRITASYGELTEQMVDEEERVESVTVNLETYYEFSETTVVNVTSATWEGDVYDETGSRIHPAPAGTFEDNRITFPQRVFGVLRLSYRSEFDKYFLTIQGRGTDDQEVGDPESAYESTVMAFFNNQVVTHEVDLPDITGGNCTGGGGSVVSINPDDDGDCYDLYIKYHKCTGEKISENKVQVPCPE